MNKLENFIVNEFELTRALNELETDDAKIETMFVNNSILFAELTDDDKKDFFNENYSFYVNIKETVKNVLDNKNLHFADDRNFFNLCDSIASLLQ